MVTNRKGVALIFVLWLLVLIGLAAAEVVTRARTESAMVTDMRARALGQYAAESGILLTTSRAGRVDTYVVNGNAPLQFAWPYGSGGIWNSQSAALPIPLTDLHDGTNTITLTTSDTNNGVDTANFDNSH